MSQKVYVLKLKSGEELIARIDTEKIESTIVLDQPMAARPWSQGVWTASKQSSF